MTDKKPLTSADRYEILKKVKTERAAQAPVAAPPPTKTKRTVMPKAEKVLSQAEKKRREAQTA